MTDRLITFLKLFGYRGARTLDRPNSWAFIALWRRAFELKEEEREEQLEAIAEIADEVFDTKSVRPVAHVTHVELRKDILQEHYREMKATSMKQELQEAQRQRHVAAMRQHEDQQVHRPNLDIPLGDNQYVTLAQ